MTGRKIVFHILPLSFDEILYKDQLCQQLLKSPAQEIIANFASYEQIWGKKLLNLLEQYLIYGGYPRILLTDQIEKKKQFLNEIYTSYIQKDITDFLKIENVTGFNKFIQYIALTTGQVINKSELCLKTGLSHRTLDKYLQVLQDTFIIENIQPYFSNKLKEITKNPKLYFLDPGIRNSIISNFNPMIMRSDQGFLQEIFLLRELGNQNGNLKFWRTKVGAEVDFILDKGEEQIPFEYKSILKKPAISRSFQNYLQSYKPSTAYVLNHNQCANIKKGATEIKFIPYHWFSIIRRQFGLN